MVKRLLTMVLVMGMLAGCSAFGRGNYVAVEPHNESYQVETDTSVLTGQRISEPQKCHPWSGGGCGRGGRDPGGVLLR